MARKRLHTDKPMKNFTDAKPATKSCKVFLNWNPLNADLNEETAFLILKKVELIDSPASPQSMFIR